MELIVSTRLPAPRRRRQLLDVALGVFASRGFHGTSMNDVAATAGVTKPVLYQHFRSKRSMYVELLDDVGGQLRDAIGKATAEAATFEEQVEQIYVAYFRFIAERPGSFELLFGGDARSDVEFADVIRQLEESLADMVAGLLAAGDCPADLRQVLGHAVIGIAEGTARHWTTSELDVDPLTIARQVAAFTWTGLRGSNSALLAPAHQ